MRTTYSIILLVVLLWPSVVMKAEEPEKNKQRQNTEFSRKNFARNPQALEFAITEIKLGDQFYDMGNWMYVDALFHYLNAYTVNADNAALNYKIGKSYLMTFNKQESLKYLEDAYLLDPSVSPDLPLLLAQSYHLNYRFDKAAEFYNIVLMSKSRGLSSEDIRNAETGLMQTYTAIEQFTSPKPYIIQETGSFLNSLYPDYCPVVSADGKTLYFTSRRANTTGGERDPNDFKYNEDIYKAVKTGTGWQLESGQPVSFNTTTHDATVGLSADGRTMMIYRGTNGGDLFMSQLSSWDEWSAPSALTKINTTYKESSAAISADGQMLYFTSDRPGGFGGLDIYVSILKADGSWGNPINLGPAINSEWNEEGVSLNADGSTLYFSSNGPASMGGYDVFKSRFDGQRWMEPENMGYPLNTPDDDVFFTFTGNEEFAYFSSERPDGYGSQDIYSMQLIPQRNQMIVLNGLVVDKLSGLPVEFANVYIRDEDGQEVGSWNNLGMGTPMYSADIESGKKYYISVRAEGYHEAEEVLSTEINQQYEQVMHITELNMLDISKLVLPNVFFDFDSASLRQAAIDDLNYVIRIMNEHPELKLEISGHTDIVGSWDYNLALSKKRATTVFNYLTTNGISNERLMISWHSFDMPWGDNSTDMGRQFNRRTELRIIEHNNQH